MEARLSNANGMLQYRLYDGQILSLDSCPSSSEYEMAETINLN
jgi:hypothetical protein